MSDEGRAYAKRFSPLKGARWWYHYALGDLANSKNEYRIQVSDEWLCEEWPGLTPAVIERARAELLKSGDLVVVEGGNGKKAVYQFKFSRSPQLAKSTAQSGGVDRTKRSTSEPHLLIELEVEQKPLRARTARDDLFDAVAQAWGVDTDVLTGKAKARIAEVLNGLTEVGATPSEVKDRAGRWRQRFPNSTLTPQSLERDWPTLGAPSSRRRQQAEPDDVFYDPKGNVVAKPS